MFKTKFKRIILFFALAAFFVPLAVVGVFGQDFYTVYPGNTVKTVGESDGITRYLTNNSNTVIYFVPNKTALEWISFRSNKPSDLEFISACGSGCGSQCYISEGANDMIVYDTVLIGSTVDGQCWLTENLKTRYRYNGTSLVQWNYGVNTTLLNVFSCMTSNNTCTDDELFYRPQSVAAAADFLLAGSTESGPQGVCPSGWNIPSEADEEKLKELLPSCYNSANEYWLSSCLNNAGMQVNKYGYMSGGTNTLVYAGSGGFILLANYNMNPYRVYDIMHIDRTMWPNSASDTTGVSVRCMKTYGDSGEPGGGGEIK